MHLGYTCSVPDESRHARLQQRNLRKRSAEDCDYVKDEETGVGCQTETVETVSTFCQTDKELTVLQGKQLVELKTENAMLHKEVEELKCKKEVCFTEKYLMKEENQSVLKFYTGS